MTKRTSNRSAEARAGDADSGNGDLRGIVPQLKITASRTRKMILSKGLVAQLNALNPSERPTPTDQPSPGNSTSVTLSP